MSSDIVSGQEVGSTSPAELDPPLRQNRDFLKVLIGQGISGFGDAVTYTALPLLVLALTGSGLAMGIVGVLGTLPNLLLGLPAGALADRSDRRMLMFLADAGRAVLTALIPLSALLGLPTMAVVVLVVFPINACQVLFMAAWTGSTPNLVGRRRVGQAVAVIEALMNLTFVIGPAIAGILVGVLGAGPTLAIDALSFAVSAGSLWFVRRPLQGARSAAPAPLLDTIREGLRFVARHQTLRLAIGLWTGICVFTAGLTSALAFAIVVDRGLGATDVGIALSAYGLGGLLGSLVGGRLAHGSIAPTLLLGTVGMALSVVVLGLGLPAWSIPAAAVTSGLSDAVVLVCYLTFRTTVTPEPLLSRVGSTARTISIGLQPIGLFVTGVLLDRIGGNATMLAMGGGMLVLAGVLALSPSFRGARIEVRGD